MNGRGRAFGDCLAIGGGATGLLALIIYLVTGFNFGGVGGGGGGGGEDGGGGQHAAAPADDRTKHFVAVVLNYTEEVWKDQFNKRENGYGRRYVEPKLVLFTSGVRTGCGNAPSSVGPFYCPADQTVYLDPSFFDELQQRLGEVDHLHQRVAELEERIDFAERMLARAPASTALPGEPRP